MSPSAVIITDLVIPEIHDIRFNCARFAYGSVLVHKPNGSCLILSALFVTHTVTPANLNLKYVSIILIFFVVSLFLIIVH